MKKRKICVAMSGGVDSSVAALLLKRAGHDVFGVFMKLWDDEGGARGCCSVEDSLDALRVAEKIGIPLYVLNMKAVFRQRVVDYFLAEYLAGRTPNPCIYCNSALKFDSLFRQAETFGADGLATGHYARIVETGGGAALYRCADGSKDQTYFLFSIPPATLPRLIFPLGDLTKADVRIIAGDAELINARKRESQDICFVRSDYREFLKESGVSERRGAIVDVSGNVVGEHRGYFNFTVGQRSRLGVAVGRPVYVLRTVPDKNLVVVGDEEHLFRKTFVVNCTNFFVPPEGSRPYLIKIRSRHGGAPGRIISGPDEGCVVVEFDAPQRGITPGQAAVFYDGDRIIGGGWIDNVR